MDTTNGFLTLSSFEQSFCQLRIPLLARVSLLTSKLGFEIVTQLGDTGKRPSSHLQSTRSRRKLKWLSRWWGRHLCHEAKPVLIIEVVRQSIVWRKVMILPNHYFWNVFCTLWRQKKKKTTAVLFSDLKCSKAEYTDHHSFGSIDGYLRPSGQQ